MPATSRGIVQPILLLATISVIAACTPVNTLPAPARPADPVEQFELILPGNLEVRHVDFSAALASGGGGAHTPASVEGRGFREVYAVDRDSGDSVLLIYENVGERKEPVQVFRFRRGSSER